MWFEFKRFVPCKILPVRDLCMDACVNNIFIRSKSPSRSLIKYDAKANAFFFIFAEEIYQSIESYEAQAEDELSFDVGVMLKVVEKTLDGWWLVR